MALNENAQKWNAALKSGEFEQARGQLKTEDDHFCCLGVACELYRRETGQGEWEQHADDRSIVEFRLDEEFVGGILPPRVQSWLGLREPAGAYYDEYHSQNCLTADNDAGYTFDRIATIVESEPDGLFKIQT